MGLDKRDRYGNRGLERDMEVFGVIILGREREGGRERD